LEVGKEGGRSKAENCISAAEELDRLGSIYIVLLSGKVVERYEDPKSVVGGNLDAVGGRAGSERHAVEPE